MQIQGNSTQAEKGCWPWGAGGVQAAGLGALAFLPESRLSLSLSLNQELVQKSGLAGLGKPAGTF